eukprot:13649171-Ditylum_brightwellii.AAC.1
MPKLLQVYPDLKDTIVDFFGSMMMMAMISAMRVVTRREIQSKTEKALVMMLTFFVKKSVMPQKM